MTDPDRPVDELLTMAGQLADGIIALTRQAQIAGVAEGLEAAAKYVDATIREAGIIGEALAILLIIRDQIRLMSLQTTTPLTEDDDAASSRPDDLRPDA